MFQDLPSLPSSLLTSLITPILPNGDRDGGVEGAGCATVRGKERRLAGFVTEHCQLGEISADVVMASGWRVGLGGSHGEAGGGRDGGVMREGR